MKNIIKNQAHEELPIALTTTEQLCFNKIHLPKHCQEANESDHSQSNFHTDSGFTNILYFLIGGLL